jgi:alpha-1,3-rhamnosyltransferase
VAACLRSIIKQTLAPSQLIVIDDGSTDESVKVIKSVLQDCPFPSELIVRENRGLSATLNHALALTTGTYFAYLSSDDVWLEDFLAARVATLRQRPNAVLAYGHAYFINELNQIVDSTADWANYLDGNVKPMLLQTIAPMSPTVLYSRDALARHQWNEQSRLEDFELYLKLSSEGEFAFDPQVLSAWRWHETNASWNQQMMLAEQLAALARQHTALGLSSSDLEKLQKRIRFSRAEDFLRVGDKKKAYELIMENFGAIKSPAVIARLGARLLLPYGIVVKRRQEKHRRAFERYGSIES